MNETLLCQEKVTMRSLPSRPWYEQSRRRLLVDMHIPDWNPDFLSKADPVQYARMMKLSGADTAIVYAGNCLGICFWPTRIGHMHAGLHGRDLFGETLRECRASGLRTVGYFNVWSRFAYDTHPEWRMILPDGKGTVENGGRFGLCCPNTGFGKYVDALIGELTAAYRMDGLWVDMIGWLSRLCVCPACRARFRRETGSSIPDRIDWDDPAWTRFVRVRERWLAEFAGQLVQTAKKSAPGISVALQDVTIFPGWGGGGNLAFTQTADYMAGDFYGDAVQASTVCKLFYSLSKHRPVEYMVSRCEDLTRHTAGKSLHTLMAEAYSALANNAAFVLIDAIDPVGTLDRRFYGKARRVFAEVRKYEKYLSSHAEPVADVAIYYSFESMYDANMAGTPITGMKYESFPQLRLMNMVRALAEHHIPYTFISRKDLGRLSCYRTVLLPAVAQMDDGECAAFRRYVIAGGSLYASGETSLYDTDGVRRRDFGLADVFGVSFEGKTLPSPAYAAPTARSILSRYCTSAYPLQIDRTLTTVQAGKGTRILAVTVPLYTDPKDDDHFASAISNPPGIPTDRPYLVRHRIGSGTVLYSIGELESPPENPLGLHPSLFELHRDVFAGLVESLRKGTPSFWTDAPKPIEISAFRDDDGGRIVVNLQNRQESLPPIPIDNVTVRLRLDAPEEYRVIAIPGKHAVETRVVDQDSLEFNVNRIEMFRMFAAVRRSPRTRG